MVSKKDLRPAIAAGKFYSASADILEKETKSLIAESNYMGKGEKIFALIAPHAGYKYAGAIYGSAYAVLKGQSFKTAIIIGNSHHAYFDGDSIYAKGAFETPLGEIPIDIGMAKKILGMNEKIKEDISVHAMEHSIEVHLPFLKAALGNNIKIVPVLMGNDLMPSCRLLASVLKDVLKDRKDVLIIASTDMSHYPSYQDAYQVDNEVLDMIQKGDAGKLENFLHELELREIQGAVSFLCGAGAVKTVMLLSKEMGATVIRKLKYANSGDAIDEKTGVVGYGAVSFSFPQGVKAEVFSIANMLTAADKKELFRIAKMAVEAKVKGEAMPEFKPSSPVLNSPRGAFVTLKKGGSLRGCIGRIITNEPLYKTVREMAIEAAASDSRFIPVAMEELPVLEYEISVLGPMEKVSDPYKEIEIGRHGVHIKKGFRSGIFLPQVAKETGWDLEKFMGELCSGKAGIEREEWKNKSAEIYRFTAEVVEE